MFNIPAAKLLIILDKCKSFCIFYLCSDKKSRPNLTIRPAALFNLKIYVKVSFARKLNFKLEVGVDLVPLVNRRNDVQCNQLVAHLAEVSVACVEQSHLLGSSLGHLVRAAVGVESCVHSHHDVLVLLVLHVCTCWPCERLATHDGTNHLYRAVGRTLP